MNALVNGWERWEPDDDLKKGKEVLSTNWRLVDTNKKVRQVTRVVRTKTMMDGTMTMDIIRTNTTMWRTCLLNWIGGT